MTDSKHTRWVYSETYEGDEITVPYFQVCELENSAVISATDPGAEDDIGHLIAAAPDMSAEMTRFLPVLERAEADPAIWEKLTAGLGIATANGYRAAISKALNAKVP